MYCVKSIVLLTERLVNFEKTVVDYLLTRELSDITALRSWTWPCCYRPAMSLVIGLVRGSKKLEILWRTEVCLGFLLLPPCSSPLCNRTSRLEEVFEGELWLEGGRLEGGGRGVVIGLNPYNRVLGGWNFPLAVWNVIGRLVKMCWLSCCWDPGTANACNWVMAGAGG